MAAEAKTKRKQTLKTPVKHLGNGRVEIDVLAVRRAFIEGTLSEDDREIVERMLPSILRWDTVNPHVEPGKPDAHTNGG
jgi:hypothetical protein